MISKKYKCIFIHIPKNAGTSIEYKIDPNKIKNYLPDHRTIKDLEPFNIKKLLSLYKYSQLYSIARRIKYSLTRNDSNFIELNRKEYDEYFKFTIVRNPWSRVYSWYRGVMRDKERYRISDNISFKQYLNKYLNQPALRSQLYWLEDSMGNIPFDYICKFENLYEDFGKVSRLIGLEDSELPRKKYTGNSNSYIEAYDDEMKAIIARRYKEEINFFNFSFDR